MFVRVDFAPVFIVFYNRLIVLLFRHHCYKHAHKQT